TAHARDGGACRTRGRGAPPARAARRRRLRHGDTGRPGAHPPDCRGTASSRFPIGQPPPGREPRRGDGLPGPPAALRRRGALGERLAGHVRRAGPHVSAPWERLLTAPPVPSHPWPLPPFLRALGTPALRARGAPPLPSSAH